MTLLALDRLRRTPASPSASNTRRSPRGARDLPAAGKHRVGGGEIERRDEPGAERQRRHVGQIAAGRRRRRAAAPRASRRAAADRRRRRCSTRAARRAASARRGCSPCALRGVHSGSPAARYVRQARQHRHRRVAVRERRGVDERLERRAGLPPAARRAVERAARDSRAPPTIARMSPVAGSIATSAASRPGLPQPARARRRPPAPPRPAARGRNVVCTCQSGGLSPPNSFAELLAQVFLRLAGARVARLPVRLDARPRAARRLLLRRR